MADDLLALLRQWDRPRYLALLLMPEAMRPSVLALYAFNAEVDRIPLMVSEPQIGEIRFQWWLDTLDAIADGTPQDHPVAAALADAIQKHHLPIDVLKTMTDARVRLLYADRPETIAELEEYLGQTSSALIQLTALVLDPAAAPKAATAAGYAGVAQGLAQIVSQPQRFANLVPKSSDAATLVSHGLQRLTDARASAMPSQLFPAFLPATLAAQQLHRPDRPLSALAEQWHLWRASRRRTL